MAKRGGSAGIAGYNYQCWFIAYQISKLILDENKTIHPEAEIIDQSEFDTNGQLIRTSPKVNYVEDVVVYNKNIPTVYNIKYLAPQDYSWTVNELISQGVIKDIFNQVKAFPNQKIVFVSQSSCPLFNDLFKRVRSKKSKKEVELSLTKKQKLDWESLKKNIKLNDKQLIKFAKYVYYERGLEIEKYKEQILSFSKGKFDHFKQVPLSLYSLAIDACIESKPLKISDLVDHLERNNIRAVSSIKILDLIKESKKASASLKNWNNIFGNISSSHIKRSEVDKILNWINNPIPQDKKPILVITGKAGCGKSVIMRDVLEEMIRNKTHCIGLKVDLYDASNHTELNSKLNLDESFEKLVSSLAASGKLVVILDQLDSLSMSLSSSRKSINFYFDLINRMTLISNIRIILTCRSYDLNFDPTLNDLRGENKVDVGDLSVAEIDSVLKDFDLQCNQLPVKFTTLIRNPQHLNIFCSIYDKDVKLEEIKSIQDLYNELWEKKISNNIKTFPNLIALIKEVVNEMSMEQKLNVTKILYLDRYALEIRFLTSEGIFSSDSKSIQFFHQTFFEYCFARFFFVDKRDLIKFILRSHQGLFIRSTIKHVLTYQKNMATRKYFETVSALLVNTKVRFHIKFLVLNIIGSDDNPLKEELEILKKSVISNRNLRQFFLESITNIYWFNQLNEIGYVLKYLTSLEEELRKSCETMFYKLIEIEPIPILKFLLSSPDFSNKQSLTNNLMLNLKDWDNEESIQLFESIQDKYDNGRTFYLSSMLEKAFKHHKRRVASFLGSYLNKRIEKYCVADNPSRNEIYGNEMEDVFNKFYNADPKLFAETILPQVKMLVYCSKFDFNTQYIVDKAFFNYEQFDSIYSHWKLIDHLIDYSEKVAKNDEINFEKLIVPFKEEKSLTLINVFLSGLLNNKTKYLGLLFDLLKKPNFLRDYNIQPGVGYKIHTLINNCYQFFNLSEKVELNQLILLSEDEKLKKGDERKWKGSHIYRLLNSIPESERKHFHEIQKKYLELQRKFGVWNIEKPHKSKLSSVGPPLPEKAYKKMTLENWLSSFKEYNESTSWDSHFHNKRGFHFGGLDEHSQAFSASVKNNPDKFFFFLEKLLTENIAVEYISAGLIGLIDSKYDPQKVVILVKKIVANKKDIRIRKSIIRAIEYVDKNSSLDNELFEIIKDFSLNDPDPSDEIWLVNAERKIPYYGGDPLAAGINSVRGSAVFALLTLQNRNKFINEIFDILQKVNEDKFLSVKCSAVANLHILIRFDEERTFKLFYILAKNKNPHILRNSLNCLSYYSKKKFHLIKDLIIASSKIEGDYGYNKVKHFVGQILMYLYTEGVRGSKDLFESLFKSSPEIQAGALNYSFYLLNNKNLQKKSKSKRVFLSLLNSQNHTIQNEYSHSFQSFTPEMFSDLYVLLLAYCKNRNVNKRESYNLYKYLVDCMDLHPERCINLVEHLIRNFKVKEGEFYSAEDPIKLLVGSYNKLKEYRLKNIYLEKAMDIFDKLVQIPNFRHTTNKVLFDADYN